MKASLLCAVACAACASAPLREPSCTAPANRVEIQHVQVGWQRQDPTIQSPVVDPRVPTRDPRQAEDLARNLLDECRSGSAMEVLNFAGARTGSSLGISEFSRSGGLGFGATNGCGAKSFATRIGSTGRTGADSLFGRTGGGSGRTGTSVCGASMGVT